MRSMNIFLPLMALVGFLFVWEIWVDIANVSKFILPPPSAIFTSFAENAASLFVALAETLRITLIALALAVVSGIGLALGFSVSKAFERTLYPFAVMMQVTPVVSIAPLVLIWVGIDHIDRALVIIAWLAAFFPILTNMSAGLKSADKSLQDLFTLYGATRSQRFWMLLMPSAMPYLLASLKISAGLALIGAVVAEFVAGSGGATGLAWRIMEAGNRLQVEKMFAGLFLLAIAGMVLFYSFSMLEYIAMRKWHPDYYKN